MRHAALTRVLTALFLVGFLAGPSLSAPAPHEAGPGTCPIPGLCAF